MMSGVAYALEWLIRITFIPLVGRNIDQFGIRLSSIFFDIIRIIVCLLLVTTFVFHSTLNHFLFTFLIGLFSGIISVSNAQVIIVYEKYILFIKDNKKDVGYYSNMITIADQISMITGSIIGIIVYNLSESILFAVPIVFYLINLSFFLKSKIEETDQKEPNPPDTQEAAYLHNSYKSHFILFIVFLACSGFFSNMIDGLVEASGSYIIQEKNALPIELYVLINITAGIIGVVSSHILDISIAKFGNNKTFIIFTVLEFIFSICLALWFFNFYLLMLFYSLAIGSKIATITLKRTMRMKVIKTQQFAFISSILVSASQFALPITGGILYFSQNGTLFDIRYIVALSSIIILATSALSLMLYKHILS